MTASHFIEVHEIKKLSESEEVKLNSMHKLSRKIYLTSQLLKTPALIQFITLLLFLSDI
jgi:hypothetical protein